MRPALLELLCCPNCSAGLQAAYRFLSQRTRALANGTYFEARHFVTNGSHDELEKTILLWGRNEILLLAEKQRSVS